MDNGESRDAARRALAWLVHPVSVVGLALLLINDHLLKAWQPGFVTGKLSDVAGLLMFAPLLAVLAALVAPRLPDRALAIGALAVTAAGFTFVKATSAGAELASAGWSVLNGPSVIRADASDLLALPVLGLAWWCWVRTARRPAGRGPARLARALVLLPIALLATVATTPAIWPETIWLGEQDGQPVLGVTDAVDGSQRISWPSRYAISSDDGVTWRELADPKPPVGATELTPPTQQASGQPLTSRLAPYQERLTQDCAGDACYRVVLGELHVQSSLDGGRTWTTTWQIHGRQLDELTEAYESDGLFGLLGSPAGDLSSNAVLVHEVAGGHVVLVANGRDGLLRRDIDGQWTRLGTWDWTELAPPPELAAVWAPSPDDRLRAGAFTVAAITLFALTAALVTAAARQRARSTSHLALVGVAGGFAGMAATLAAATVGPDHAVGLHVAAAGLSLLAFAGLVTLAGPLWRRRALPMWRVAVLAALAVAGGFVAELWRSAIFAGGVVVGQATGVIAFGIGGVLLVALIVGPLAGSVAAGPARSPAPPEHAGP